MDNDVTGYPELVRIAERIVFAEKVRLLDRGLYRVSDSAVLYDQDNEL